MALFQVDGWDLKEKNIKVGGESTKPSKKSKKRARSEQKRERRAAEGATGADEDANRPAKKTKEAPEAPQTHCAPSSSTPKVSAKPAEKKKPVADVPMPATKVTTPATKLTPLQQKMMNKLSGSRFRWINEQLYTITSDDALSLIKDQPELFDEYHEGFRSQVQSWPENPVDVFVNQIETRVRTRVVNAPGGLPGFSNKQVVIADMGCGEAKLALDVGNFVAKHNRKVSPKKRVDIKCHSFDLKKVNDRITVADIKNVPLADESCTVVVFCLALMGTNFLDFIQEAYRILAPRGELWIAEIKSRFSEKVALGGHGQPLEVGSEFVDALKLCGFFHKKTDNDNKMFTRFEFFKPPPDIIQERKEKLERRKKFIEAESEKEQLQTRRQKQPEGEWLLKPCIYKRR
ncbi:Ribosomal RNA-processing protein 8 [[Candida] zeylanoides]